LRATLVSLASALRASSPRPLNMWLLAMPTYAEMKLPSIASAFS
jgi:hypothetical protein